MQIHGQYNAIDAIISFRKNGCPDGIVVNSNKLASKSRCTDIMTTATIQEDGSIAPCCGIVMSLIPELQIGNIKNKNLNDAELKAVKVSL